MKSSIRNALAIIAGILVGSLVNIALIRLNNLVIDLPSDIDLTTYEGLQAALPMFQPKHFVLPFAAHAFGTFTGAWLTALIAQKQKLRLTLSIGGFFLLGGTINAFLLPVPLWFIALDLAGAYLPMSYLGGRWASMRMTANL